MYRRSRQYLSRHVAQDVLRGKDAPVGATQLLLVHLIRMLGALAAFSISLVSVEPSRLTVPRLDQIFLAPVHQAADFAGKAES